MLETIAFDFDGVIHKYRNGWQDGSIYDEPDMVIVDAIKKLMETGRYAIIIMSTREPSRIISWVCKHGLFPCEIIPKGVTMWHDPNTVGVTDRKLPAVMYIDDRAFRYNSSAYSMSDQLLSAMSFHLNK